MYRFVGYDDPYYQGIVSMSESEKVMVVSSRGSLDNACISSVSPDLMLHR